jgi:N-acyl-D-aspartate/D-glutamate deacylase
MEKMLKSALKEGAFGLSTGLVYTHAKLASEEEITGLLKTMRRLDGVYVTHVRGEASELLESVEEAIRTAQKAGVKLQISHLKAMGKKNWPLMERALGMIEAAHNDGLDIDFDVYPYTMTGSVLYVLLPDWAAEGGKKMMLERLKNPDMRRQIIGEMMDDEMDYSKIVVSISPLDKTLTRRRVVEIARSQGKSVEETIIDILVASEGRVITMMEVLSEKNLAKAIQHPLSIISTNGSGYNLEHKDTGELVHPRSFGTFPRVLFKYVKSEKILSWEEAIHKMSGKPATKFNLTGRGRISEGNFADLVVIDPATIQDLAGAENPYQYSRGINWVIVNGKVVLKKGVYNGKKAGEVIRR